jgi:hypothetical protein
MNTGKNVNIKTFGAVTVISLIVLAMVVTPLTATMPIKTPKYAPKSTDLPFASDYRGYRATEGEHQGSEYDLIYEESIAWGGPSAENGGNVHIYEFSRVSAAKTYYDSVFEMRTANHPDYHPYAVILGDEGIQYKEGGGVLFRTGRFVVELFYIPPPPGTTEVTLGDIAYLTEQNIKRATSASPTMLTTPKPTFKQTPQMEEDSDGDGVPDEYDYAPHDSNVQTKSDAKTQGFGAIFAMGNLLAVAYLIRRRRGLLFKN